MALNIPSAPYDPTPILTAMGKQNALTSAQLDNKIKESQAQYAPYASYGDALSKIAAGQMAAPNAIAQVMSSPGAGQLTREQMTALINRFQSSLGGTNQVNIPNPDQMGLRGGGGFNPLGLLMSLFSGGGMLQSSNPMNVPSPGASNQNQMSDVTSGAPSNAQPSPTPTPTSQFMPNTPQANKADALKLKGTMGGDTPQVGAEAKAAGTKTGAVTEATNIANQWNEIQKEDKEKAQAATNQIALINKLRQNYKEMNMLQKGVIGGKLPAFTSPRSEFDKTNAAIQNQIADQIQRSGHVGQADREAARNMKFEADMPEDAFNHTADFLEGFSKRDNELQVFHNAASKLGYTPNDADVIWNYYVNQRPFYDAKNHKLLNKNFNTWDDFLKPDKVKEAFDPKMQVWFLMKKPDGSFVEVAPSDYSKALKRNYTKVYN